MPRAATTCASAKPPGPTTPTSPTAPASVARSPGAASPPSAWPRPPASRLPPPWPTRPVCVPSDWPCATSSSSSGCLPSGHRRSRELLHELRPQHPPPRAAPHRRPRPPAAHPDGPQRAVRHAARVRAPVAWRSAAPARPRHDHAHREAPCRRAHLAAGVRRGRRPGARTRRHHPPCAASLHRRAHEPKPAKKSEPGLSNRTVRYTHTALQPPVPPQAGDLQQGEPRRVVPRPQAPRPPPHLGHPRPPGRHRHPHRQRPSRPQHHPHHPGDLHPRDHAHAVRRHRWRRGQSLWSSVVLSLARQSEYLRPPRAAATLRATYPLRVPVLMRRPDPRGDGQGTVSEHW